MFVPAKMVPMEQFIREKVHITENSPKNPYIRNPYKRNWVKYLRIDFPGRPMFIQLPPDERHLGEGAGEGALGQEEDQRGRRGHQLCRRGRVK